MEEICEKFKNLVDMTKDNESDKKFVYTNMVIVSPQKHNISEKSF